MFSAVEIVGSHHPNPEFATHIKHRLEYLLGKDCKRGTVACAGFGSRLQALSSALPTLSIKDRFEAVFNLLVTTTR